MTQALRAYERSVNDRGNEVKPSPYLIRVLDDVEKVVTPREKPVRRPAAAIRPTPRPFAYD